MTIANELMLDTDPTSDYCGDLALDASGNPTVSGPMDGDYAGAVAQRLQIALRIFQGEYEFDPNFGMPYYQEILGAPANLPHIIALFTAAILNTPGVLRIEPPGLVFDVDKVNRVLILTKFVVLCEDGSLATAGPFSVGGV